MHLATLFIFLGIWLLVFWVGSLALEASGMERRQARFQALSAMTNSGFTTVESEQVMGHAGRRRTIAWLIFIGNVGMTAFIVVAILLVSSGLKPVSLATVVIILAGLFLLGLFILTRVVDRLSDLLLAPFRRGRAPVTPPGLIYQSGGYGLARYTINAPDLTLNEVGMLRSGVQVLSLERQGRLLPAPAPDAPLEPGDSLLCYGKLEELKV